MPCPGDAAAIGQLISPIRRDDDLDFGARVILVMPRVGSVAVVDRKVFRPAKTCRAEVIDVLRVVGFALERNIARPNREPGEEPDEQDENKSVVSVLHLFGDLIFVRPRR